MLFSNFTILSFVNIFTLAIALFEQCNYNVDLKANEKIFISSSFYPNPYPTGTSCRYMLKTQRDYQLYIKCDIDIKVQSAVSTIQLNERCHDDIFYFNREGSELLSGSEYFCGSGTMERKSFLNHAVISYISMQPSSWAVGNIKLGMQSGVTAITEEAQKDYYLKVYGNKNYLNTSITSLDHTTHYLNNNTLLTNITSPLAQVVFGNAFNRLIYLLSNRREPNEHKAQHPFRRKSHRKTTPKNIQHKLTNEELLEQHGYRIISNPSYLNGYKAATGNGRFSCLVKAVEEECDCGWSAHTLKVVSPSDVAGINEYVSMAGVLTLKYGKIFCGAVIIHHRYLLSAAHCFMSAATNRSALIQVVVGEHDLTTEHESVYTSYYNIDKIILHEHFQATASQVRNDIALLRTNQDIDWNRGVAPACLPFHSFSGLEGDHTPPIAGQQVETAGWGSISFGGPQSTLLRRARLDVIGAEKCNEVLGVTPPTTFCTYTPGQDTCQYDSGGGLYMRNRGRLFVVGIVSYGYGCAAHQPSVNTKVASYLTWIRSRTPLATYCLK